jgi:hypothetical protein
VFLKVLKADLRDSFRGTFGAVDAFGVPVAGGPVDSATGAPSDALPSIVEMIYIPSVTLDRASGKDLGRSASTRAVARARASLQTGGPDRGRGVSII